MKTSNCFLAQQPGADELYDIAILTPEDSIWPVILWSLLALVLLIGALTLAICIIRSRKPVASLLSPKEKAAARFRLVQRRSDELKVNEIMLEVSDSLKDYLAEQYNDPLRYETTQEFLARILKEKTQLPIAAQEELRGFIVAADEVKFGSTSDSNQKCLPLINVAKNIVNLCETSGHQRDSNRKLTTHRE
jgi:hypothetical protein